MRYAPAHAVLHSKHPSWPKCCASFAFWHLPCKWLVGATYKVMKPKQKRTFDVWGRIVTNGVILHFMLRVYIMERFCMCFHNPYGMLVCWALWFTICRECQISPGEFLSTSQKCLAFAHNLLQKPRVYAILQAAAECKDNLSIPFNLIISLPNNKEIQAEVPWITRTMPTWRLPVQTLAQANHYSIKDQDY